MDVSWSVATWRHTMKTSRSGTSSTAVARAVRRVRRSADGEHGAGRVTHDVIGDRPQDEPGDAAAASGSHHDHARAVLLGRPADLVAGLALQHGGPDVGASDGLGRG